MKFLTYIEKKNSTKGYGFLENDRVIDIPLAAKWISDNNNNNHFISLPNSLKEALENWDYNYTIIKQLKNEISSNDIESFSYEESDLIMLPPVPDPPAFRDFYAFEQHVKALGNNMKVYSTDICVPISKLVECVSWAEKHVKENGLIAPMVGHVGDGNFHSIILYDPNDKEKQKLIRDYSDKQIREIKMEMIQKT